MSSAIEGLRAELEEAVRLRLISDVPIGVFLSGGLDSSAVTALMARASGQVKTFSVTFQEDAYDESTYSRWVATRFKTEHTELHFTWSRFLEWLPASIAGMDQPTFDGINSYFVARAAKEKGLTVSLSGLGADELFGGYLHFRTIPWISRIFNAGKHLPVSILALISRLRWNPMVVGPGKILLVLHNLYKDNAPALLVLAAYQATQMPPQFQSVLLS